MIDSSQKNTLLQEEEPGEKKFEVKDLLLQQLLVESSR
jgi:hypothetical protein